MKLALQIFLVFLSICDAAYIPPNNPPANISPDPYFYNSCEFGNDEIDNSDDCTNPALQATNYARSLENVSAMILPTNYASLTVAQQLFVIANLERVGRELPPMEGLVASYNSLAQTGADDDNDPMGPSSYAWGSNWAGGFPCVLGANYAWMYMDGPGGENIDCTSAHSSGCWGHRDNILGNFSRNGGTPLMGAAYSLKASMSPSMTQLFVDYTELSLPTLVYTWQDALHNIPPPSSGSKAKIVAAVAATFIVCAIIGIPIAVFFVYRRWKNKFISAFDSVKNRIGKLSTGQNATSSQKH